MKTISNLKQKVYKGCKTPSVRTVKALGMTLLIHKAAEIRYGGIAEKWSKSHLLNKISSKEYNEVS